MGTPYKELKRWRDNLNIEHIQNFWHEIIAELRRWRGILFTECNQLKVKQCLEFMYLI